MSDTDHNGDAKITVRIDPELRREVRIAIAKEGVTLQAYVAEALREKLAR